MNETDFRRACERFWNAYFERVEAQTAATSNGRISSFPQSMIVTELSDHFVMELVGARRIRKPLKVIRRSSDDGRAYFGQLPYPDDRLGMVHLDSESSGITRCALITPLTRAELDRRFPGFSEGGLAGLQWLGGEQVPALTFGPSANLDVIDSCLIVNALDNILRIRHIRFAIVVQRGETVEALLNRFEEHVNAARPYASFDLLDSDEAEATLVAQQFANIYLINGLRETSIGTFLEQHEDVLLKAFDAERVISQPLLKWQVVSPDPHETAIQPDLMLVRADGSVDVCDLKLPLLDRKKDIAIGDRRRRRFISSVGEGIAQLSHYRDFLTVPENQRFVEDAYGVRIADPSLRLIIGTEETVDPERARDASRSLRNVEVVDYDTVLQLYLRRRSSSGE